MPWVGGDFRVSAPGAEPVSILLTEVTQLASDGSPRRRRTPFSRVFHAPAEAGLEQGVHVATDPGGETHEWFLVPLGPDAIGARFEAIFT